MKKQVTVVIDYDLEPCISGAKPTIPTASVTVRVDGQKIERQEFDDHSGNFWTIEGDIYDMLCVVHQGLE